MPSLHIQSHWMLGLQHMNFGRDANIQSITEGEVWPTHTEHWRSDCTARNVHQPGSMNLGGKECQENQMEKKEEEK